ncbi:MAG: hypothetical protein M3Q79_00465 [bacterium]|nr:hypothetical protein [bacterium]
MQQSIRFSNIKLGLVAIAFMASSLIVVGGSASASQMSGSKNESKSKSASVAGQLKKESQAASDLRTGLTFLLRQHVTTNLDVNRSIASGASQAEIDAGIEAQMANSDAISAAIGSIYGAEAEAAFSEMFLEHIEESNNFAVAVAAGDESSKALANEELIEYLEEIATFFSDAIPVLPYEAVYGLLLEHETLINKSTEASASVNFGQSQKFEIQALKQVTVIANALASGIIATQPDLF